LVHRIALQIEVDGCSAGSNASKMVFEPVRIGPSSSSLATHIHARPRKIWNGITRAAIRIRVGRRRAETRQGDPKKRACHLLFIAPTPSVIPTRGAESIASWCLTYSNESNSPHCRGGKELLSHSHDSSRLNPRFSAWLLCCTAIGIAKQNDFSFRRCPHGPRCCGSSFPGRFGKDQP
jgi:hypothetical protein